MDYHTDFTIVNAMRKDTGKYTLIAENANGKDEETVELTVLGKLSIIFFITSQSIIYIYMSNEKTRVLYRSGKPDAPKGPLEVTDITATSAKVKWEKPEDDGGVPIKEYEIEKLDTKTGKWVRVGKVPGNAPLTEFEVTGLNPGSEYKFRVTAVNDEGDSEPLESERGIIARNPYGKTRRKELFCRYILNFVSSRVMINQRSNFRR